MLTDTQVEAVGWIAVIFLGLCALLWLADATFGIVKTDGHRKILNGAIGGTFLGGVASAAVALLGGGDTESGPGPETGPTEAPAQELNSSATKTPVAEKTADPSADATPDGTPTPTPSSSTSPAESEPAPAPAQATAFSAEVREWAEKTLPPRPFLDEPLGSFYPPCVARLRLAGKPAGPSSDAGQCFNQLQDFNRQVINQHRDRRAQYIPQVDEYARNEANKEKWRYLRAEYASFTFGKDAEDFGTLSAIFLCDQHLLVNLRDYGLLKERPGCPLDFTEGE